MNVTLSRLLSIGGYGSGTGTPLGRTPWPGGIRVTGVACGPGPGRLGRPRSGAISHSGTALAT